VIGPASVRDPDEHAPLTDHDLRELARTAPIADDARCPHATIGRRLARAACSQCVLAGIVVERALVRVAPIPEDDDEPTLARRGSRPAPIADEDGGRGWAEAIADAVHGTEAGYRAGSARRGPRLPVAEHGRVSYRVGCRCPTCCVAWADPVLAREENSARTRRGHEARRRRLAAAGLSIPAPRARGVGRPPTRSAEPIALPAHLSHGSDVAYKRGCGCAPCLAAHAARASERRAERAAERAAARIAAAARAMYQQQCRDRAARDAGLITTTTTTPTSTEQTA